MFSNNVNKSSISDLTSQVSINNLKGYVQSLEGFRHGWENYDALEEKSAHIENAFRAMELQVQSQDVPFHGRTFRNIIAGKVETTDSVNDKGRLLIGAHYDAASGSPGADDNASGVAVLLEAARILRSFELTRPVRFVAFTLEEPQPQSVHFLIGSRHFAEEAKKAGDKYDAVLILESVGYASDEKGSQIIPAFVRAKVPDIGNFLAVVANRTSSSIMKAFQNMSNKEVPDLPIAVYKAPFSGYLMPETRFSDHASFWDCDYPALMLTDTAMFRNPYYHTEHDRAEHLDFEFMAKVTKAVITFAVKF